MTNIVRPDNQSGTDPSIARAKGHPENGEGAAKATQENDLTTGHSTEGDGGDQHRQHPLPSSKVVPPGD